MKVLITALLLTMTAWPPAAEAQGIKAYGIATNFTADNKVLELTVPPESDGERFVVVWNSGTDQSLTWQVARAGTHAYEMRHVPKWKGPVDVVATTLQITGRVKEPQFSDEIDMFLAPERITAATVNGLMGHTFWGIHWEVVLLIILVISAFCIAAFKKKRLAVALVLGFVISAAVMDARATYDDAVIISKGRAATGVEMFSDRAAEIIHKGTWGSAPPDAGLGSFLRYRLAEIPFVPEGSGKQPDFWITTNPNEGQVVLQFANYYLLKKTSP
jgi:hypothetical protein